MKSLNNMSLAQVYPEATAGTNLNCCGDPDCGNYGIAPETSKHSFAGKGGAERRMLAANTDPSISTGLGRYRMVTDSRDELHRETSAFEFSGAPVSWSDGRSLICQHMRGNANCGVGFSLLSNQHFEDELARLTNMNGVLNGPRCGNCGTGYLDAPEEFIFNGTNGQPGKQQGRKGKAPRKVGKKAGAGCCPIAWCSWR